MLESVLDDFDKVIDALVVQAVIVFISGEIMRSICACASMCASFQLCNVDCTGLGPHLH